MNNRTLIDTSFMYALYNNGDKNHAKALSFSASTDQTPLVPEIILPEVTFLFARDIGHHAIIIFLEKFVSTSVGLQSITTHEIRRAKEIMAAYPAARFDFVDACIMALAERLEITRVCTFDRRDFIIFRPTHCEFLELLP